MKLILSLIMVLLLSANGWGEDIDTSDIILNDSSVLIEDSTIVTDTLTDVQKAQKSFEDRQKQYKKEKAKEIVNYFSFSDSLNLYFLPQRLNIKPIADRSTIHSAGDYFKFDPSYFVIDPQETPMRNNVKPFGLAGDRLNINYNGIEYRPNEHIIEPDGMVDLNDIPTALNDEVYIIPGAYGMLFGGDQAISSLISTPERPENKDPITGLVVDKGGYDYSYIRGRYSKIFSDGREIDLSSGYRNAEGVTSYRDDDSYHYTGRLFLPLGKKYSLSTNGQVYNRTGSYVVTPDKNFINFDRNRIEKGFDVTINKDNQRGTSSKFLGYRYHRNRSYLDGDYKSRLNGNQVDFFTGISGIKTSMLYKFELTGSFEKYNNGYKKYDRSLANLSFTTAKKSGSKRLGLTASASYIEDFKILPAVSISLMNNSDRMFYLFSAGYVEKAPTLNDLYLPKQESGVYFSGVNDYSDSGNQDLQSEKQAVASAIIEFGPELNSLRLSSTGGIIFDGIEWQKLRVTGGASDYDYYRPINEDVTFVDFQLRHTLGLSDNLKLLTGAAYHLVDYESGYEPAYQPDYQLFSGMELHLFWPQKQTDLFAYGEIIYAGEYNGYRGEKLGQDPIINIKLSFQIKSFRFHYVWQNPLLRSYQVKEDFSYLSRLTYYGITWHFFD